MKWRSGCSRGMAVVLMAAMCIAGCSKTGGDETKTTAAIQTVPESTEEKETFKIGFSVQNMESLFPLYLVSGAKHYLDTNNLSEKYELIVMDPGRKADMQLTQVETMISDNIDVLIINPVDTAGSAPCVDAAVEAGIPVITVNTFVENQDKVTAHVGADDTVAGRLQMEAAIKAIGGKGNVAVLHGTLGHSAQVLRWAAYKEVADKYEGVEIVADQEAKWKTDIAQTITENWIQSGREIDAIVCNNDNIAIGAVNAIESSGAHGEIQVVGIDALANAIDLIKKGELYATFDQDAMAQGEWAVRLAIDLINGKTVEDKWIEFTQIDASNVDEFIELAAEREKINSQYTKNQ